MPEESLLHIIQSSSYIKMNQYIKLLEKKSENAPPLKIPIHNAVHEVDLEYFVGDVFRPDQMSGQPIDGSMMEIEQIIKTRQESIFDSASCLNYLASNAEMGTNPVRMTESVSQYYVFDATELRNLIINYLPQLREIYRIYATLCSDQQTYQTEPVMIRLFLWQLYRDIGVTDSGGVSIIEVDEMLYKNPTGCLETEHNPWEPIYFWQFLQALVGVAGMLFTVENQLDYTPSSGFMYHMFKNFLDHKLLIHAENFQGNCLRRLKDLTSIDAVYRIYKEMGEPHSVEDFLKSTCMKKGQNVPCYKLIDNNEPNNNEFTTRAGTNVVVLNNELSYSIPDQPQTINEGNRTVQPRMDLYTFSVLGRKKILKSLHKICPQILLPNGRYRLQYKLSFIEFYEALLLMAFEKVEHERLALIEDLKVQSAIEVKSTREMSRMSTSSSIRKKKLKGKFLL